MKSTTRIEKIVTLELNEEEVIWLQNLMQNPIDGLGETDRDREFRHRFWDALNENN